MSGLRDTTRWAAGALREGTEDPGVIADMLEARANESERDARARRRPTDDDRLQEQQRLGAAIDRLAALFPYGDLLAATGGVELLEQAAEEIVRLRREWPWSLPEVGDCEQLRWSDDGGAWCVVFGALWIWADRMNEGADAILNVHDVDVAQVQALIARRNAEDPPRAAMEVSR